jgi:hypothetical protein
MTLQVQILESSAGESVYGLSGGAGWKRVMA